MPGGHILCGSCRGLRIEQIHLDRLQPRVRPVRHPPVERDDVTTGFKHRFRDGPADTAAGACDDRDVALAHDLIRLSAPAASSAASYRRTIPSRLWWRLALSARHAGFSAWRSA